MLWYGVVMLFVGGTIFSYVVDGYSGVGSTRVTAPVDVGYWVIPVETLSGFVPEKYGQTHVEMEAPVTLAVGDTETMEYIAGIYVNGDDYWTCATPEGRKLPAPCLFVHRSEPVVHAVGEYVYNDNAAAINEFIGFRMAEREEGFGAIALPFQMVGAISSFVVKVMIWDWQFLEGNAQYFKWFLLWPLSAMLVVASIRLALDTIGIFS